MIFPRGTPKDLAISLASVWLCLQAKIFSVGMARFFVTTNVKENIARDKISCAELLRKC